MPRLICLPIEDLRRLDAALGGRIYRDIEAVILRGGEPALVVRREPGASAGNARWFVGIVGDSREAAAAPHGSEYEIADAHGVAVLGGMWLADLRAEVAEDVRRRLDEERSRS